MSFALQIKEEEISSLEGNILTSAFHGDIENFLQAEEKLEGATPGSFLTYSINHQNYCSAVWENGKVVHNPFRWDASGAFTNASLVLYATHMDLLDHLVNGQTPVPFYSNN
jgi:hypothetical protein